MSSNPPRKKTDRRLLLSHTTTTTQKENATPRHVMEKALTPLSHSKQLPSLPRLYYWYTYMYGKSGDGVGRGFYRWCLSRSFSPAVKPPGLRNVGVVVVVVVGMFKNAPEVISMLNFEVISEVKKANKGKINSFAAFWANFGIPCKLSQYFEYILYNNAAGS